MNPSDFSLSGAVDLSARKAAADRQATTQQGNGSPNVIEVTEDTFNTEVVERSRTVPVVLDLWADWCQPCKQLSPVLEKLAAQDGGAWVLAKIDADANPRLASALRVQSLPTVMAVVGGQAVNGFQGALPEAQVREWIDQLMAAVTGQAGQGQPGDEQGGPEQQQVDPEHNEAAEAIERGDFDAAAAAYQRLQERSPGDPNAAAGLTLVKLLKRSSGVDDAAARREAASNPEDVDAQCRVADLDIIGGRVDEAFDRLVGTIRRVRGEDRDRARTRLLELFELLPDNDPRVTQARAALANALF